MAESLKDKVATAGHAVADAAKTAGQKIAEGAKMAGHKIAENAKDAKDWVADKTGLGKPSECSNAGVAGIRERMDVIASCGKKVGVVDHVEGSAIKLTKNDSADGQHHFIPTDWVDHVDSHVHLTKNSMETEKGWKGDASACGACGG